MMGVWMEKATRLGYAGRGQQARREGVFWKEPITRKYQSTSGHLGELASGSRLGVEAA
jgi:hypothetical protein